MNFKTHITLRQRAGQDVKDHFFENFVVGSITTEHPASSYGQPIVLLDGQPLNYSEIESLTVVGSELDCELVRQKLEPLGVRVTRATPVSE